MFRAVFWVVLPFKIIFLTRQNNPEDSSEHQIVNTFFERKDIHAKISTNIPGAKEAVGV
jgi:hypothetical protein